jgi:hypothetical protein
MDSPPIIPNGQSPRLTIRPRLCSRIPNDQLGRNFDRGRLFVIRNQAVDSVQDKLRRGWGLPADSDLNGRIDDADYAAWRSHFGQPSGSGSLTGGAIPEPATWTMLLAATWSAFLRRRAV